LVANLHLAHFFNIGMWNQRMTVLGTVAYMAPELVNAQPVYTEAIDVYAMGITFWEIWTGKDPFAKENTFSLYQLIAQGSRPEIPSTYKSYIIL
jgi:serine/threonine protein kinase